MSGTGNSGGRRGTAVVSILGKLQSAALGVVAAILTVLALDQWKTPPVSNTHQHKQERSYRAEPNRSQTVRTIVVESPEIDRVSELERQLKELQAQQQATVAVERAEPPEPSEVARQMDAAYEALDQAHDDDLPDPEWAPEAERNFASGLSALGQHLGFSLAEASCKTTTCRATVTWKDYASARSDGMQLAERFLPGLNCEQRIRLEEPEDPTAAYSTRLYLDCKDQRAGNVEEIAIR